MRSWYLWPTAMVPSYGHELKHNLLTSKVTMITKWGPGGHFDILCADSRDVTSALCWSCRLSSPRNYSRAHQYMTKNLRQAPLRTNGDAHQQFLISPPTIPFSNPPQTSPLPHPPYLQFISKLYQNNNCILPQSPRFIHHHKWTNNPHGQTHTTLPIITITPINQRLIISNPVH